MRTERVRCRTLWPEGMGESDLDEFIMASLEIKL